jgi:hypothetical protein
VLNQLLGHSYHICYFLCKYVLVSPKEVDERAFLFIVQPCIDQGRLGWIALLQLDGLEANIVGVGFHRGLAQLVLWGYI